MEAIKVDYEYCTGCSACLNICPKHCIGMDDLIDGFYYPSINNELCVKCGLCRKVCPIHNASFNDKTKGLCYYSNDDNIRKKSTSGGFFTKISDYILNQDGIVYGAIYDDSFMVIHARATDENLRNKMRCSKYVQSNIGVAFDSVRKDLIAGKVVLFTGTPCQVAGLNNYLSLCKIATANLITCDLVCHGTPSPVVWKDYLNFVQTKYNDTIEYINFRDKAIGWHKPQLKIQMKNHVQAGTEAQDPFYQLFYSNCILRKSCHLCEYSKLFRVSDITMADCWGIENSHPELDDNKGLSLLLINTHKGETVVSDLGIDISKTLISVDDIRQPHLYHPAAISRHREKFWISYKTKKFRYILNVYGNYSLKSKFIKNAKRIILKALGK